MPPGTDQVPGWGPEGSDSTSALLRRVAVGDRTAFLGLYDRVGPAVYTIVQRRRRDESSASALMEHVFVSLWGAAPTFLRQDLAAEDWILSLVARSLSGATGLPRSERPGSSDPGSSG